VHRLVEVETGKGFDAFDRRPQLAAALAAAKKRKAPVIVAKLVSDSHRDQPRRLQGDQGDAAGRLGGV
jgi:hypothetical protein